MGEAYKFPPLLVHHIKVEIAPGKMRKAGRGKINVREWEDGRCSEKQKILFCLRLDRPLASRIVSEKRRTQKGENFYT